MKYTFNKTMVLWISVGAVILAFVLTLNILSLTVFDALFTRVFKSTGSDISNTDISLDLGYYKSDFENTDDLQSAQKKLVSQISEEGIVLLQNDGILPLAKSEKINFFSHSSVDFVYGGTGSGTADTEKCVTLKQAFENEGYTVNKELWDFYLNGNGSSYKRGEGAIGYGDRGEDWSINECPISVIKKQNGLESTFDGTAVFVISRTGGEGRDLARGMYNYTDIDEDKAKHYLEPDSVELGVIDYINEKFDNVIVIINTNNAFELGWVKNYSNIKAVLSVPGPGLTGLTALADIFSGDVNPSGHLVDTWVADNFSSPAMQNMGDFQFTNGGNETSYYYVMYAEDIYVGYKYYETRYEDVILNSGNADSIVGTYASEKSWNYDEEVVYPFGYGESYTAFEWSDFRVDQPDSEGNITVSLTVKNAGEVYSGKDIVQIYFQSPYTDYDKINGIEKSAVNLCAYAKTKLLSPNEQQELCVTFNISSMKSYDACEAKTYIMEEGTYYITAASDSHEAIKNILRKKGCDTDGNAKFVGEYVQKSFDSSSYSVDSQLVTNCFDHAEFEDKITKTVHLTRNDWQNSYPKTYYDKLGSVSSFGERANDGNSGKQYMLEITSERLNSLKSTDSLSPIDDSTLQRPTLNADKQLELIQLRGRGFDDENWDKLLSQLTETNLGKLIAASGYETPTVNSIGKPRAVDLDGPAGLNNLSGHESIGMTYPCELLIACTWNQDIAEEMGKYVAEDGLWATSLGSDRLVNGWYAPAVNIHRTPFGGRNFEYYSEDGFLSGTMASAALKGAASKGMYSFVKHFALNDQENHRSKKNNGIATYANEQTIREIYLVPFEMCVKSGTHTINYYKTEEDGNVVSLTSDVPVCMAIMSSYNRIGDVWAGGNYNLLTSVCRNEWGFNGFILTDYDDGGYMNTAQMLRAGGDAKLNQLGNYSSAIKNSAADAYYSVKAAKHILYCVVNSNAMNNIWIGSKVVEGFAYYKLILFAIDAIALIGEIFIALHILKKFGVLKSKDER